MATPGSTRAPLGATLVLGLLVGLLSLSAPAPLGASGTYAPPLPPRTNKKLLTGEKLWRSKKIIGPGGQTCAGCHDSSKGPALNRSSLQRQMDVLHKIIYFELVSRCGNPRIDPEGREVKALVAHLENRYSLEALPNPEDNPQAEVGIAQAHDYYLQGDYSKAIDLLQSSLRLPMTDELKAEAHILLGCIYHVLNQQTKAMQQFFEVLRIFPEAQIDRDIYSPKTVDLFEAVRSLVGLNSDE